MRSNKTKPHVYVISEDLQSNSDRHRAMIQSIGSFYLGDQELKRNVTRQGGDHGGKKDDCSRQKTVEDLCKGTHEV